VIPEPKTRAEMEAVMATHEMVLRKKPCVDCAFNRRSPENEACSGPVSAEGGSLVDHLKQRIEERDWMPFFCHEGMECVDRDGWRAVVGIPEGATLQICHGWNELMQAKYRKWKAEQSSMNPNADTIALLSYAGELEAKLALVNGICDDYDDPPDSVARTHLREGRPFEVEPYLRHHLEMITGLRAAIASVPATTEAEEYGMMGGTGESNLT